MGDDMTNQEAIKIVEDMIESMNDIDVLYAYEQDALNQLIKTAKKYDALIASDKNYTYEDLINMALRER